MFNTYDPTERKNNEYYLDVRECKDCCIDCEVNDTCDNSCVYIDKNCEICTRLREYLQI